ncbi:MAG TPA: PepSY-associated TM helix domain-containing protein [Verrucomicrobiales bacterium]|nr:PepSY-associated TM helix domain-containing protein [Verrucomicrobiales bacterium]
MPFPAISRLVRRVHLFTGLFLAPWMMMYALSTLVMTHHESVRSFYSSEKPAMVTERELDYSRSFPAGAKNEDIAQEILRDLGMEGAHEVSGGKSGSPLVIDRMHALPHRRITFDASKNRITMEREEFRTPTLLDRLHRRRGYNHPYTLEDTWGFSVDVAVVTMVFWSLSGIWLAWEIKTTRLWGALSLVTGLGLFALFAVLI